MADVVFSLSTCTTVDPSTGLKVRLSAGEAWWASDPFVKRMSHLFSDVPAVVNGVRAVKPVPAEKVVAPVVESATAVPGAKRQVKRASEK